ncbi:F-box/kelch-repeat protein At3g23880-like [Henckelia pumila]|uniref:F-box/kelch-repeat protein At3g23880-like n=1 Tax=Henckelia pumila TaxID=405737 RepID=UPI003C6DDE46
MNQTMLTRSPIFLLNLPSETMINILSRIPIQTILSCKCVCKQLLHLLSTTEFAASHLPFSTPGLVILQSGTKGNLCQIFEYEDGTELQHSSLHLSPAMEFDPNVSISLPDVPLRIVGSVNGLLCLREYGNKVYDALYICNPITREYIALPRIEGGMVEYPDSSEYGFGVSKISGQYKVVRNIHRHSNDPQKHECLVYTVGTRSWRQVIQPGPPLGRHDLSCSLFLKGNLHGSVQDYCGSDDRFISCFDLESESFKPFPAFPPPPVPPVVGTLGILDECLCFVDIRSEEEGIIAIWVMKEYGVEKSWTEILVIEDVEDFSCTYYDSISVIRAFKNGDILLNWNNGLLLYYNSKTKTCEDVDLGIQINEQDWIQAIPHSLSFLSLKIFYGENVLSFS